MTVRSDLSAQGFQGLGGRAAQDLSLRIEARPVTRAGKTLRPGFHGAAQMGANQAEGAEAAASAGGEAKKETAGAAKSGKDAKDAKGAKDSKDSKKGA